MVVTEVLQVAVVALVALALHWSPHHQAASVAEVAALSLLATFGLAGIGLALAGRLRAEVNLAATNGLYLVLLLLSGIVVPASSLPSAVERIMVALPSGALAQGLHRVLEGGVAPSGADWATLVIWAVLAPLIAARTFRFD